MDTRYKLGSREKLRGGYYTPAAIADWLCRWAIRRRTDRVLEPSCGDGVFLVSAVRRLAGLGASPRSAARQTLGVELLAAEAQKSRRRLEEAGFPGGDDQVLAADFFQWASAAWRQRFECVVGNPPFIRYHNFPEPSRTIAMKLMRDLGLKPNRLTNVWVPFVAACTDLLVAAGRLAMVLPAELLQVSYAAQLRRFLADSFSAIALVTCNDTVFPRAQQEVVLFLGEGKRESRPGAEPCTIELIEMNSVRELLSFQWDGRAQPHSFKTVNHMTDKWLKYFLSASEIELLRELRQSEMTVELGAVADVDIGVVTGTNQFFVLTRDQTAERGLEAHCVPVVARANHLSGAAFSRKDHARLAAEGQKVYLFVYDPLVSPPLPPKARRYVSEGESKGFHKGYKCSIRQPWFAVPAAWTPDYFLSPRFTTFPGLCSTAPVPLAPTRSTG